MAKEGMMGPIGVRRPLRFLAHKLELDESQTQQLAEILDDLRTERSQAEVDDRRAQKLYAECLKSESFDAEKAKRAGEQRVQSTQRVQTAVLDALAAMHALLSEDQRARMALLVRTGPLVL
jgi:Spy/CpxP family protein refolding chaperone